jgi:hypothetical protein
MPGQTSVAIFLEMRREVKLFQAGVRWALGLERTPMFKPLAGAPSAFILDGRIHEQPEPLSRRYPWLPLTVLASLLGKDERISDQRGAAPEDQDASTDEQNQIVPVCGPGCEVIGVARSVPSDATSRGRAPSTPGSPPVPRRGR